MEDPIQAERTAEHIRAAAVATEWLARTAKGMTATLRPSEVELAFTLVLARMLRQAYPARTRAELAAHVHAGVLAALEGTDDAAPEIKGMPD